MDKKCDCGGKLIECEMSYTQTIRVPNGYNFPKTGYVRNYVCESCGRIYSYAEFNKDNKK